MVGDSFFSDQEADSSAQITTCPEIPLSTH